MTFFPGGDSYFGALLNSWIHVLMYAYYALTLLKISCPWKKYLTQAQLLQFTFVVVYTFFSIRLWPAEECKVQHIFSAAIQVWEMASLFALFSFFYMKSYGKRRASTKLGDDHDQCQKAVKEGVTEAALAVEAAAKNAGKFTISAKGSRVKCNPRTL